MGVLDFLKRLNGAPAVYRGQEVTYGPSLVHDEVLGMLPAEIWRTQPHLRTVVTFIARNIAQLGLHSFLRTGETDRQRLRDGNLALALARPNANTTTYELVFGIVADLALYDVAYLHVTADSSAPSGWSLYRLPPVWVTPQGGDAFGFATYKVLAQGGANGVYLPAASIIDFHGWNPEDARYGSSPVGALKAILAEQMMAVAHRQQVWQRGGRISSVITRPAESKWSDAARESFRADWNSKFTGDGARTGGTPILEDGMTISKLDFNAHEQQFVEAARLALATVAGVFHVNPTMLGDTTGANYSNVREFRSMLYGDTLGPVLSQLQDRLNTFLVPLLDPRPGVYVEFNIAAKMQGNFEEQAAALSTSVGAPYMLRSEARARMNLPSIPDADTLVVPLNVLVGGQASPRDSVPPKAAPALTEAPERHAKARASQPYEDKYVEVVHKFFRRQGSVVKTRLGLKADGDYWDEERWDSELSDDLYRLAVQVTTQVSAKVLDSIGFAPDAYDVDRTLAWLKEVSNRSAKSINTATKAQIDAALAEDDPSASVANVFDIAEGSRSAGIALTAVTMLSAWASQESAHQVAGEKATKTWMTGGNPRSSHAMMDGETVPLSENFSNGMAWPGDASGGSAEDAGCNCELLISVS
jgi:HK97 family phage portal protein